jgi:small GTP-binding protein domain
MAAITTKTVRNVALLGHGGSGKTSVAETMLYISKATERMGKTPDGNTVCDYDAEEIKRGFSLSLALAPVMWADMKINILDTPGYLDFAGEVMQGLKAADSAIIAVDGKAGLEVGTELAWDYATAAGLPKAFFINKCDDAEAHFDRVFNELRDAFGVSVCPLFIPMKNGADVNFLNLIDLKAIKYDAKGAHTESSIPGEFEDIVSEYRNILYESIAETSEELMEKFFAEEEITREEALMAIHEGIIHGTIVPVFCGSAVNMWGIDILLDTIADSFPRHTAKKNELVIDGEGFKDFPIDPDGETAIFVFKTIADPFVGKMSFFKVMNGTLKRDMVLKNSTSGASEKMAHIYTIRGKKQTEVEEFCCGDIGVTTKLANTNTNDTLTASSNVQFKHIEFPEPYMCQAIQPLAKGDEDKISTGITKLLEEDLSIKYENNAETKQMLIYGLGDIHLDVVVSKLKTRFGTSVQLTEPKLAYRETIKKKVQVEGKHKKQSGGHGQYGHVKIEFSPGEEEGLTFTETIFGGSVPKNFHPAVEKGLLEAMVKGIAGYPMVGLKANLFDGSYHDVDSSEMSFKMAASLAYKECLKQANPVILEPIGSLKVTVPDGIVGDVMGDLNKRRGRVAGVNQCEDKKGYSIVEAEAPKGEMTDYTIALRAMSQGRGKFVFKFERYEEAPAAIAAKIKAAAEKEKEEE